MRPRLALTLGDPLGIGPEVLAKALRDPALSRRFEPLIFGDPALLCAPYIASCDEAAAAQVAAAALQGAVDAVLAGRADALVTAPLHKAALRELSGGPYMGHTGYLAARCQRQPLMTFVADRLRLALLTVHVPLAQVPQALTELGPEGIAQRLRTLGEGLRHDLGVARPRIALCGLNPHAGEAGMIGGEEAALLRPALELLKDEDFVVEGPLAADGLFADLATGDLSCDAVMACSHDQGLVGFKALCPRAGAQISLGLPIVRSSVEHGTARNIAGQGRADASSMRVAIEVALSMVAKRKKRETMMTLGAHVGDQASSPKRWARDRRMA